MDILSKYVCKNPFNYLDVQTDSSFVCCPSWCGTNINFDKEDSLGWKSKYAEEIRKSVLDGSYKYCDKKVCPSLNQLLNQKTLPHNFIQKSEFEKYYSIESIEDLSKFDFSPEFILFGFDRSCNLKCPSCRLDLITNNRIDSKAHQNKLKILNQIETNFSKNLKKILITGSGDPFYSNIYREYLQNFDVTKYPNLENIALITNGLMLNEKMWNSLKSKELIKTIEVSIDAGTKETYENVTRLNGKWDTLIKNLKFISTLETVKEVYLSFVVSELNYKEINIFYDYMMGIFENSHFVKNKNCKFELVYRQHVYWSTGKYTENEVESIKIFNPTHPKYEDFLKEFDLLFRRKHIHHNFAHIIKKSVF